MNLMIYPLGCFAFWAYGFAIGWGNWFNGPVPPGWYASLGPGLAVLNEGVGIEPAMDADGSPTGVFKWGLLGTKGFFLHGVQRRQRDGPVLLHDGVLGHHGHDSHRRHGRTLGVEELLPLRTLGRLALLHLCQLGLGRRLAGPSWA